MTWSRRERRDVGDSDGMVSDHRRRRVGVGVWCIPVWGRWGCVVSYVIQMLKTYLDRVYVDRKHACSVIGKQSCERSTYNLRSKHTDAINSPPIFPRKTLSTHRFTIVTVFPYNLSPYCRILL